MKVNEKTDRSLHHRKCELERESLRAISVMKEDQNREEDQMR